MKRSFLGFMFIMMALLAFAVAFMRQEFALLMWASFFMSLIIVILFTHLVSAVFLRSVSQHISFKAAHHYENNQPVFLDVSLVKKIRKLPFFHYTVLFTAQARHRHFSFSDELERQTDQRISGKKVKRGCYEVTACLFCRDSLGLFSQKIALPQPPDIIVLPSEPVSDQQISVDITKMASGQTKSRQSHPEERYESRKYYPGDDARLVNWKQVSRFNELFLRVEEKGAKAINEIILAVFIPPFYENSEEQLDQLINTAVTLSSQLSDQGNICHLMIGNDFISNFNGHHLSMRYLLSPYYSGQPYAMEINQHKQDHSLVFVGSAADLSYVDTMRRYATFTPVIIATSPYDWQRDNISFIAKSLRLEVVFV